MRVDRPVMAPGTSEDVCVDPHRTSGRAKCFLQQRQRGRHCLQTASRTNSKSPPATGNHAGAQVASLATSHLLKSSLIPLVCCFTCASHSLNVMSLSVWGGCAITGSGGSAALMMMSASIIRHGPESGSERVIHCVKP